MEKLLLPQGEISCITPSHAIMAEKWDAGVARQTYPRAIKASTRLNHVGRISAA